MAELSPVAVAQYTSDRLDAEDPETQRLLNAGLAAARRFCGWHVTPAEPDDVVTIDGPGARLLVLPTLRLDTLTALSENGVEFDVAADLHVSARGLVCKRSGAAWTSHFGGIVATMTHGFDEAPDFDAAVLSFVDRMSQEPNGGRPIAIGPFRWSEERGDAGSAFTTVERSLLDLYALEKAA